ncbi:hypothetical protein DFW101_3130 [Solidesulfovibrio carbinoliphilus subsp. oakridgensis]|uniref:Uncharacterized protein n=1 Tax=Solidesulfovibrio carbinoliphilus subsp. oakridgensis TaxID=694327 RepID=G7Q8P3_9BACT|nr:hypothetical protein DFW101_3130 [Solidesulfovibrio carbinoliphilus subsp. oakridgensis]
MIDDWWLLTLLACGCLPLLFGKGLGSSHRHLPRDFDFDQYKNRELNLRGLFDKTRFK